MHTDPLKGLFKRRMVLDLPGGEPACKARELEKRGLLKAEKFHYVRCVNSMDRDQQNVKDHHCSGKIPVIDDVDEDNHEFHCPDCGRVIFPSKKHESAALRLTPDDGAIHSFLVEQLKLLKLDVKEQPKGLFRIPTENGEVQVCYVDGCYDTAVFDETYARRDSLVFVVGNDRDYMRRLPRGATVFRLADLALDNDSQRFVSTLRRLAKQDNDSQIPVGPAILGLGPPRVQAHLSSSNGSRELTDVAQLAVPIGTRWNQIEIFLADNDETVVVRTPGQSARRYHYSDLGMANKKSRLRTKQWDILIELCRMHGSIDDWKSLGFKNFAALKTRVSELRKTLQEYFGLTGDPIPICGRSDGIRTAFLAYPNPPGESEPYIPQEQWQRQYDRIVPNDEERTRGHPAGGTTLHPHR